ncbi:methyl-accepting chemotaxis protein [Aquabacterium sp.]|uniref:methyl-accepting chemotaxis protein n=1 Tax=Aquabacterium sp. TaxID=1872578 RepID=UPI0035AEDBDE
MPIGLLWAEVWRKSQHDAHFMSLMVLTGLFLAIAGYLFFSFYLVMGGGLREVRRHLKAMTDGDLTQSPSPWGHDEMATLMLSLTTMQDSMRVMVANLRSGSDNIMYSSSEIAAGALDLSARTEQTAANLEQSASSMEEVSSTVQQTAGHAKEAASIADQNAVVAARGGQIMESMVATMDGIHRSSSKISEIISVIDGIAFQTNILALNAAVEAARAGEAGRGFAVVASEVRSLAQRSAGAAREIKTLITESVEKVETGSAVVADAGKTIGEIVTGAHRINDLLNEIASAAQEQSQGVSLIGQSVNDLDHSTQANAALVEQTAAAAHAMQDQAKTLAEQVARFRLPAGVQAGGSAQAAEAMTGFNFDQAIEAHRQWKVKLRAAIDKHEKLDAETICRDDCCALGKWLHGPGGAQWGSKPAFVALVTKHAGFHKSAGEVARKINAGSYAEAERLIGGGSEFALASTEVSMALTRAKRGL